MVWQCAYATPSDARPGHGATDGFDIVMIELQAAHSAKSLLSEQDLAADDLCPASVRSLHLSTLLLLPRLIGLATHTVRQAALGGREICSHPAIQMIECTENCNSAVYCYADRCFACKQQGIHMCTVRWRHAGVVSCMPSANLAYDIAWCYAPSL